MKSVSELMFGWSSPFVPRDPLESLKEMHRHWEAQDRMASQSRPVWSSQPLMNEAEIKRIVDIELRKLRQRKAAQKPSGQAMRAEDV